MLAKVRYNAGGSETGALTTNAIYIVLAFLGVPSSADVPMLIIDNNGAPYKTVNAITDAVWTLVSVVEGKTQVFP